MMWGADMASGGAGFGGNERDDDKRVLDVEKALHWAYRDELPKTEHLGTAGGSSVLANLISLGCAIDSGFSREPGFPAAMGAPHPDAFAIDAAVQALDVVDIDWAANRGAICPDCLALLEGEDFVLRAMVIDPRPLIVANARMGTRPHWGDGAWRVMRRLGNRGVPVVVGIDANRHYEEGAHCPLDYDPDPREVASDRAEFIAWHQGLRTLKAALSDSLDSLFLIGPETSGLPWSFRDPQPRILKDLSVASDLTQVKRRRSKWGG